MNFNHETRVCNNHIITPDVPLVFYEGTSVNTRDFSHEMKRLIKYK